MWFLGQRYYEYLEVEFNEVSNMISNNVQCCRSQRKQICWRLSEHSKHDSYFRRKLKASLLMTFNTCMINLKVSQTN